MTYLYAAYAAAALLIGGYVIYLVRDLRRVEADLREVRRHRD